MNLSTIEKQEVGKFVEFVGMTFIGTQHGEEINQDIYLKNKLQDVDAKAVRYLEPDELVGAAEKAKYSTAIGRLFWALPTQPKHSYEVSFLSHIRAYPRVKHYRRLSAVITAIKQRPGPVVLPSLRRQAALKLRAILDARAGEQAVEPLKTRDHQCVTIC